MKTTIGALAIVLLAGFAPQQKVSQAEIDAAIRKGAGNLLKKYAAGVPETYGGYELVIYTLIHADGDPAKAPLKEGIEKLISTEASAFGNYGTYRAAVQALALHSLLLKIKNNANYAKLYEKRVDAIQERIALSGQFLIDSQCGNGQWTYAGTKINTPEKKPVIFTGGSSKKPKIPKEAKGASAKIAWENAADLTGTVYLLKSKDGTPAVGGGGAAPNPGTGTARPSAKAGAGGGDNSNAQYGILGLIAAQMSGCVVPDDVWQRSLEWFEKGQSDDGGFGYGTGATHGEAYGSMTTAGTVALAACRKFLGDKGFKNDPKLKAAVEWLGKTFAPGTNPKGTGVLADSYDVLYYYMYGLERVGAFLEIEKMGTHQWYDEGAAHLVKAQQADGSWGDPQKYPHAIDRVTVATCFAILFLKRATQDIIETGSSGKMPDIDQK